MTATVPPHNDDENQQESPPTFIPSRTLKVEKLSRNVNDNHLEDIFSKYGELEEFKVSIDSKVRLSLGWGLVTYKKRSDAEQAYRFMDGAQIDGKTISLKFQQQIPNIHQTDTHHRSSHHSRDRQRERERERDRDRHRDSHRDKDRDREHDKAHHSKPKREMTEKSTHSH
eukprot:239239_1